ncbi:MAG: hypothetical protein MUE67_01730, partial [Anaerolineales bacterium]|nr:hypothetical protein [Anaerolineales bacterium]
IDDTFRPGGTIPLDTMLAQADRLILMVVEVLEGAKEGEIVRQLLRLRDILSHERDTQELSPQAEAARAEVINLVNNFFYQKLTGVPEIRTYMDTLAGESQG